MKKIIVFILVLAVCVSLLTSCRTKAIYDEVFARGMEAEAMAKVFTSAIAGKDYEKAMANVHPDSEITAEALENLIKSISEEHGITFPQSVRFKVLSYRYIAKSEDVVVDDEDNATLTKLTIKYKVVIDGVKLKMEAVFLQNSNGFGIYSYSLT